MRTENLDMILSVVIFILILFQTKSFKGKNRIYGIILAITIMGLSTARILITTSTLDIISSIFLISFQGMILGKEFYL